MLYYCGFDTFLKFKNKRGANNIFLQPLSDLVLDRTDKVINAFIGWCSLFLQTGNGQVLYLGFARNHAEKDAVTVCANVPKYIVSIECGAKETFLTTIDLELFKWTGFNFDKLHPEKIELNVAQIQNGDSVVEDEVLETKLPGEAIKVEHICVGVEYSAVLTETGDVHLVDINLGQLGPKINGDDTIMAIAAGQEHLLLLAEDGRVLSYGRGTRGQLGHGNLENVDGRAVVIEALEGLPFKAISAGGWHSLGLSEAGDVYAWGWNESGQLGVSREKVTVRATPKLLDISEDDSFAMISSGSRHSMAVSENGLLFGWGWNKYGQLGLDPIKIVYQDAPSVIPVDEKVANVCCKFWASLIETERENGIV